MEFSHLIRVSEAHAHGAIFSCRERERKDFEHLVYYETKLGSCRCAARLLQHGNLGYGIRKKYGILKTPVNSGKSTERKIEIRKTYGTTPPNSGKSTEFREIVLVRRATWESCFFVGRTDE